MKQTGIWIDQREANIIVLINDLIQTKTIYSGIESRERVEGEKKQFGRFGDQYLVDEKGKENRLSEYTNKYLNRVVNELKDSDEIMLFGPAQVKSKLEKIINNQPQLSDRLLEVKVTEQMTDNQKIAFVKKFYRG